MNSTARFEITRSDGAVIASENILNISFKRKHFLRDVPGIVITDRRKWFYKTNFSWWICDAPLDDGENLVVVSTGSTYIHRVGIFYFTNNHKRYVRINVEINDRDKDTVKLDDIEVFFFGKGYPPTARNGLELFDENGNVTFSSTYPPANIIGSHIFNLETEDAQYSIPNGKKYAVGSALAGMDWCFDDGEEWNQYWYVMNDISNSSIHTYETIWNYYYTSGPDFFFPIIVDSYIFVIDVTDL